MKLFVGNLSWDVTDRELRDHFVEHVGVENAEVIRDRETGKSKGFGFVEVATEEEAEGAIKTLVGSELRGRPIRIEMAKGKSRR